MKLSNDPEITTASEPNDQKGPAAQEREIQQAVARQQAEMKAYLKSCSKNELIRTIFETVNLLMIERHRANTLETELKAKMPKENS